jgi:glycosyltransferase involved in cell wall biosynthesis
MTTFIMKRRKKIFTMSDKLVVHNDYSINELIIYFGIERTKILIYPFPIMDPKRIKSIDKFELYSSSKIKNFLFIGHYRKEKGLELLLEAWDKIVNSQEFKECHLTVAGSIPKDLFYQYQCFNSPQVKIVSNYLNDEDYVNLILKTDCLILPYTKGTNSGIHTTALSLGRMVIASDIELFSRSLLISQGFLFKSGNVNSLYNLICSITKLTPETIIQINEDNSNVLKLYEEKFFQDINNAYHDIF